jgi:hypothetical protein
MVSTTLRRFIAAYRLELRLTFHWSYLLFLLVWSGFIIATYTQDDYRGIRGLFNIVLGFGSLIAMFLIGIQTSRPARSRIDHIEIALPTGVELLFARWLAGITALGALVIAPLMVVVTAPVGRLPEWYVAHQLLLLALLFGFISAALMTTHQLFGVRRWMYPLFAVAWVGAGVIPNVLSQDGLPLPGINLINFVTMNQSVNPLVWGQITQGQLPDLTVLFYACMVLLLVGLSVWRTLRTRFHRRSSGVTAAMIAALGIVLFAATSYTVQVYAANQQIIAEDRRRTENIDEIILPAAMPFRIDAYDVSFSSGDPAQFTAQMEVVNRSDAPLTELVFSLYHEFQIVDTSLPFTRDLDTLVLTLPSPLAADGAISLTVTYAGNITYLERRLGRPPEATYFVRADGVYLPCAVLWYPIPGRILPNFTLYGENFAAHPTCLLDHPAAFRLTVDAPGTLSYASNLTRLNATTFASDGTTWAQLIGTSSVQTTTDGQLTLITTSADGVRPQIEQYVPPAYTHLRRFFPDAPPVTAMAIGLASESFTQWQVYPATRESLYLHIDPRAFDFFPTSTWNVYYEVGMPLIKSLFDGRDNALTENLAYFVWTHYLTDGDADAMRPLLEEGLPLGSIVVYSSVPFSERYQIANRLFDAYVVHGEAAIIEMVNTMRTEIGMLSALSVADLDAWIMEQLP